MLFLSNTALVSTREKTTDHDCEKVQHQRTYLCLMFTNLRYFNIKCCNNVEVTSFRLEKLHTDEERCRTLTIGLSFICAVLKYCSEIQVNPAKKYGYDRSKVTIHIT